MKELLTGKIAWITGGTAGIGLAIARQFCEEEATVIVSGKNAERGSEAVSSIMEENPQAQIFFHQLDVANTEAVNSAAQEILAKHQNVDILVNNAGITRDQLLLKMKEDDWDEVMSVNVKSCYNLCHSLVRSMIKARKGKIINISSIVGLIGNAGQTNYAASKAAMIGFTKALAKELGSRNINVNAILPGFIETAMTDQLPDAHKEGLLKQTPLGKFGKPIDIANAALFLASELSDFVTGQTLIVDGGMAI
ncbi:MAG: 3-oxoacyl-ACP reductase FabG [Chlamydiales bacterium]